MKTKILAAIAAMCVMSAFRSVAGEAPVRSKSFDHALDIDAFVLDGSVNVIIYTNELGKSRAVSAFSAERHATYREVTNFRATKLVTDSYADPIRLKLNSLALDNKRTTRDFGTVVVYLDPIPPVPPAQTITPPAPTNSTKPRPSVAAANPKH